MWSAYWDSLCSFLCNVSPSILVFVLMASAKNSAARTNRYSEMGLPCLHPLPRFIVSERYPFCKIFEFEFVCNDLANFIASSPKLNFSKLFKINRIEGLFKVY